MPPLAKPIYNRSDGLARLQPFACAPAYPQTCRLVGRELAHTDGMKTSWAAAGPPQAVKTRRTSDGSL